MKHFKVLFMVAVFAATGMLAGCDTGSAVEKQESAGNPAPDASGLMTNLKPPIVHPGDSPTRMVKVKFEILTGGWGLDNSKGIVSLQDDSILVWDGVGASGDYTITIDVPVEDPYLNIRWKGDYFNTYYYAKAKLKLPPEDKTIPISGYTITIDFNHAMFGSKWSIGTKKLYDVTTWKNDDTDWKEAIEYAAKDKQEDWPSVL